MARYLIILVSCLWAQTALAQIPSFEIYLFDVTYNKGIASLSNPVNISRHDGYDNQPFFDGSQLYYVSQVDSSNIDIMVYDRKKATTKPFRQTPAWLEYSPKWSPDHTRLACVMQRGDEQLLWAYPNSGDPKVLVSDSVVGYYTWFDDATIASFVLGNPHTLQLQDIENQTSKILAYNIGRSIERIPQSNEIAFVQKNEEETGWKIQKIDINTDNLSTIIEAFPSSEDFTWSQKGVLWMGDGKKLYCFDPKTMRQWQEVADMGTFGIGSFTRLAFSKNGKKLAVVVVE